MNTLTIYRVLDLWTDNCGPVHFLERTDAMMFIERLGPLIAQRRAIEKELRLDGPGILAQDPDIEQMIFDTTPEGFVAALNDSCRTYPERVEEIPVFVRKAKCKQQNKQVLSLPPLKG